MTTRSEIKASVKEDINHVLEEMWDAEEEEPFFKIFTRECKKGMQKVLRCSETELQDLSYGDEYLTIYYLQKYEAGCAHMLAHYESHLREKKLFPEEIKTSSFN